MRTYLYLVLFGCVAGLGLQAQVDCEAKLKRVKRLLDRSSPFGNQNNMIALLEPCVELGHAEAENYLGMLYLNGIGTDVDVDKAYTHIANAAHKGYANAQYNLGRLYKYGTGCELSFTKAIDWFVKATANGNQRAAYTLGYMYYKGFGVPQSYAKAVYWFERSTDPMAQHFLGLCYYLGYGVPENGTKALEILLANPTANSKTLIPYVEANLKGKQKAAVAAVMADNVVMDSAYIAPKAIRHLDEQMDVLPTAVEELDGQWSGKLVQYDWSGKHILRIMPMDLTLQTERNRVNVTTTINDTLQTATGIWKDGQVFINSGFTVTLDKLYSNTPKEFFLDYEVFSLGVETWVLDGTTYLSGYVDTFIGDWTEYGQPMRFIVMPKGSEGDIDEAMIAALAQQQEQFIKLYPIPFNTQLTIQYQLDTASSVYVELIRLNGSHKTVILPTTSQQAGDYTYTIPVEASLPQGLYVVRLRAGEQVYTRLILKDH